MWETRWRQERRAREAAEASLRVLLAAPGPERCLLNGQSTTAGGTVTTLRVGASPKVLMLLLFQDNAEPSRVGAHVCCRPQLKPGRNTRGRQTYAQTRTSTAGRPDPKPDARSTKPKPISRSSRSLSRIYGPKTRTNDIPSPRGSKPKMRRSATFHILPPRDLTDTILCLFMAHRSHDSKLMSAFDEMSCSVSAQASTFCSLWVQARPCSQIKLLQTRGTSRWTQRIRSGDRYWITRACKPLLGTRTRGTCWQLRACRLPRL